MFLLDFIHLFIFIIGIIEDINIFKNANNYNTIVSSSGM